VVKKEGYRESTIWRYAKLVRTLANHTDIYDAESVKAEIAKQTWFEGTKELACDAYALLAKSRGFSFERPRYQRIEKLPFILLETEIDVLIIGTGPRTSAPFSFSKRQKHELERQESQKWTDIDFERSIATLTWTLFEMDIQEGSERAVRISVLEFLGHSVTTIPIIAVLGFRNQVPNALFNEIASSTIAITSVAAQSNTMLLFGVVVIA
jgi:hypothetical protein